MKQIEDRGAGGGSCSPSFEEVPPAVEEFGRSLLFFFFLAKIISSVLRLSGRERFPFPLAFCPSWAAARLLLFSVSRIVQPLGHKDRPLPVI